MKKLKTLFQSKFKIVGITLGMLIGIFNAQATTYYGKNSTAPNLVASWGNVSGGTGTSPANFTTAGDVFIIENGVTMTATAAWTIGNSLTTSSTLQINSGGTLAMSTFLLTFSSCNFLNTGTFSSSGAVTISGTLASNSIAGFTCSGALSISKTAGTATMTGNVSSTSYAMSGNGGGTFSLGGFTLTTGAVSIPRPTSTGNTLAVGSGTLSCSSISLSGTSATRFTAITVSTGTISVSGNFTAAGTANPGGSILTFTGAGTLNLGGGTTNAFPQTSTLLTFTPSTCTINYNGTAQTVAPITYNNLVLSGSGAKTITGITITNNLTTSGTCTVAMPNGLSIGGNLAIGNTGGTGISIASGSSISIGGNVSGNGTITTGSTSRTINTKGNWTFNGTISSSLILNFNGTGNQLVSGVVSASAPTTSSLIINKASGTVSLGSAITLNGTTTNAFTLTAGSFDPSTYKLSATTATFTAGTLKVGAASWASNYSFSQPTMPVSGIIEYYSLDAQTVNPVLYEGSLTLSGGAKTASGDITVNGILTLTNTNASPTSGALEMGAFTLNMGASATTVGTGDVTGMVKRSFISANTNYSFGNQFTLLNFSNTGTLPTDVTMKIVLSTSHSWQSNAINRYYDIIRTGGDISNKVDIQLHYLESELNGVLENSNIDFFDWHVLTVSGHDHGHNSENTSDKWIGKSGLSLTYLLPTTFGDKYWTLAQSTTPNFTWIGTISTDWNLIDNWSGAVPTSTSDVIIPDATTTDFDPSLPFSASIRSMSLASRSILNGENSSLTLEASSASAWMNDNATFNYGTSSLIFTGTNATIGGANDFYDITINSGASTTISSTGSMVNIINSLVVNGTLSTNGNLTLNSNESKTARIGSSSGSISGTITVKQFIPSGKRASRFLAHPFASAINLSQLIDEIDITGNPDGITDATIKMAGNGFTSTLTNNPSSFWFNTTAANNTSLNSGWAPFKSADGSGANNSWGVAQGIRILIRGAKGEGLEANSYSPSSTTLSMTGTPNQGNLTSVTLSSAGSGNGQGFNLVGNPMPSPIDISAVIWNSAQQSNINKTIYTRNPHSGSYVPQVLISGNPKNLPANTAVFIQAINGSPILTFTEANKVGLASETVFKKNSYLPNGLQLKATIDTQEYDVLNFAFGDHFKDEFEKANDAAKIQNDFFDLYSLSSDGRNLCTDMRPVSVNSMIPLGLRLTSGSKRVRITVYANTLENNLEAYLLDKNTQVLTKLYEGNFYDLDIDASNALTTGNTRLQVVFKQGATGLYQISNEPKISLFPNPASTFISFAFPTNYAGEFNYALFNQLGEELIAGKINSSNTNSNQINIENLATGIYFIKVSNAKTTQTIKFIK